MSESRVPPVVVVGVVVAVCGALLLGAQLGLAGRIERNIRLDQVRVLLELVGETKLSESEMEKFFAANLKEEKDPGGGVRRWVYLRDSSVRAYLYPLEGKGLWGPIHGVLAVSPDMDTITGLRITRHEETPGLGADIEAAWFQRRFEGARFTRQGEREGPVALHVVKAGTGKGEWHIDGISGATETIHGFDRMLNKTLTQVVGDRSRTP